MSRMAKMAEEWLDGIDPVSTPQRACMKEIMKCKYDHFGLIYLPTKFGTVLITQKKVMALLISQFWSLNWSNDNSYDHRPPRAKIFVSGES